MSKYQEYKETIKHNYPPENYTMLREALDVSMELLDKATPMKIETEILDITEFGKNEVTEIVRTICPNCSEFLFVNGIKHCYYCGQALDWNK